MEELFIGMGIGAVIGVLVTAFYYAQKRIKQLEKGK